MTTFQFVVGSGKTIKAQYFQSFKALYDGLYEASQMFCFTTQCNQNETFEKPLSRNTELKTKTKKYMLRAQNGTVNP